MRWRWRVGVAAFLVPGILTGCWDGHQMNYMAFVDAMTVDYSRGHYEVAAEAFNTMAIPYPGQSSPTATGGPNRSAGIVFTAQAPTLGQAMANISAQSSRHVFWATNQIIVIGLPALKHGLAPITGTFLHYPEFRTTARVFVAPGRAAALLKIPASGMEISVGEDIRNQERYLHRDLSGGWAPRAYDVMRWDTQHGRAMVLLGLRAASDPTLGAPYVMSQSAVVGPSGTFHGWLPRADAAGYLWIAHRYKQGYTSVGCPSGGHTALYFTAANASTRILGSAWHVSGVQVRVTGTAKEIGPVCARLSTVNRVTNRQVVNLTLRSVHWAQQHDADIFGWGQAIYRKSPALWHAMDGRWPTIFPNLPVSVSAKIVVVQGDAGKV